MNYYKPFHKIVPSPSIALICWKQALNYLIFNFCSFCWFSEGFDNWGNAKTSWTQWSCPGRWSIWSPTFWSWQCLKELFVKWAWHTTKPVKPRPLFKKNHHWHWMKKISVVLSSFGIFGLNLAKYRTKIPAICRFVVFSSTRRHELAIALVA